MKASNTKNVSDQLSDLEEGECPPSPARKCDCKILIIFSEHFQFSYTQLRYILLVNVINLFWHVFTICQSERRLGYVSLNFFLDPTRILTLALKATEQIPKPICITVSESESDSEMERKARIRTKNSGNRKSNNFKRKPITEIKPFLSEDFWSRNKGKLFLKQLLLS
jgi:hypothetical protein